MTPYDYNRHRWVVVDPDTGQAFRTEFALAVDLDRLTAEQVDECDPGDGLEIIPDFIMAEAVSLAALLADGLRWRAWMATPYPTKRTRGDSLTAPDTVRCVGCELAEGIYRSVDVRTAVVVPWDIMGDPRSYALVCPECAEVTPEPAPNPGHVCDTCGTETPAIWWHYHATGDGTPDEGRKYCGPCWNNLPADEVAR